MIEILDYEETKKDTGGWIPVTERLPEDGKAVLLSFKNLESLIIGFCIEDKRGLGEYFDCTGTPINYPVIVNAWMPLPEPYRRKNNEFN